MPLNAVKESLREGLFSYAASSLFHAILFLALALLLGNISPRPPQGDALSIESFAARGAAPAEPVSKYRDHRRATRSCRILTRSP